MATEDSLKILHLEDEPLDSELAQEFLTQDGISAVLDRVDSMPAFEQALSRGDYSLIISDYTIPGTDPLEALRLVRRLRPEMPFIFLSGTIGEELATQAVKLGANDYVLKQRMEHLTPTIRRALSESKEFTRRKQAEEALRRSEERLRLAQEVAQIGTFEWDTRSGVVQWSPEMASLHGISPSQFAGTYDAWLELVHPDDREEMRRLVDRSFQIGSFDGEWRVRWPSGNVRWLATRGHVFRDDEGKPLRMVGVNIDITSRKHDEEALRTAKLIAEQAKEAAEEASRAKDRFLAILSHELRTPLTAVLPALDALEPLVSSTAREYLDMASRNVELEARLIDDLLDITRIGRGKIELHPEPIDLRQVLRHALEVCQPEVAEQKIHLAVEIGDTPHVLNADPARIQQVLWNLIQNAVKFTPPEGCVSVRALIEDGASVVRVQDSGAGIDQDALGRIFDAFEQEARSTTRKFGGLGLGLAISKSLVEMHGGTIHAHSEGKGKGSTFTVRLPLADSAPSDACRRPKMQSTEPQTLHILMVEDHPDAARILSMLLRKAGHRVDHADTLAAALKLAREGEFDLLLSDLGLPDGTGYDLILKMREWGKHIPAIALSGYGTAEDIQRSLDAGFMEHVVKPIRFPVLQAALTRVLAAANAEPSSRH